MNKALLIYEQASLLEEKGMDLSPEEGMDLSQCSYLGICFIIYFNRVILHPKDFSYFSFQHLMEGVGESCWPLVAPEA